MALAWRRGIDRRVFLKQSAATAASMGIGMIPKTSGSASHTNVRGPLRKRVIVLGVDGMDPRLSERMMDAGQLPTFAGLRELGGYRRLGTSTPPQSPVAWGNFINGAGPGTHGIFDFIHRNPAKQAVPFFAAAQTVAGEGYWEIGDHKLQLPFWPFNHRSPSTRLARKGIPFWDYLDKAGIYSRFYDLPSNYPPSPSKYGHHRCLSGMGTPDMLGTYGTYQYFSEDGPIVPEDEGGGKRSMLFFENETAGGELVGPRNSFLKSPKPVTIPFVAHRDVQAGAAVIEIQKHKMVLREGQWSQWVRLNFDLSMPGFLPDKEMSGICRFFLKEVAPTFKLYVSPINVDPSDPALKISEPPGFVTEISDALGLFYTTGFQEDHKALSNGVFADAEFAAQAAMVLRERLNLLDYALDEYDDGLLFFYFSSTDLQAHMFWWDSDEEHPVRSRSEAKSCFHRLKEVYKTMDAVVARIIKQYGDEVTLIVMSDHGFANFKRQFGLNAWLKENGYIQPRHCTSVLSDADWDGSKAYGLGINGLYLNLKGRERHGIVNPGGEKEELLDELTAKLESMRDQDGRSVIRKVHRTDLAYSGEETALAPDLIIGYARGFRASWDTCLGGATDEALSDNTSAWSADHCADPGEVPGVVFSNRPISPQYPSLVDLAPTILARFGLPTPATMAGRNILRA